MRVLQITSHLNVGGITSALLSLTAALCQRGHELVVASAGGQLAPRLKQTGVAYWPVDLHTKAEFSPRVFGATRQLAARLRHEPVDVIHAHTRVGHVVAARLSRALRVPYVTTWHGFFRPNLGRWLWPCTGALTIAISEPVRQHLLRDFHVSAQRIRLIPHGIDPTPFTTPIDPALHQQLRTQLQLNAAGPVIGTVARLVGAKGVDFFIRSLPGIRRACPTAQLLIVGDGKARTDLERLANTLGVGPAVHFAGVLPNTRVALSLMDVFVFLPADQEGFGLSLLEAMASARPIVAVRRGVGAAWVLDEADVGVRVAPGQVDQLAGAVVRIVQDQALARQEADKARAIVTSRYTLDRMVDQVEAVYREVLRSR